MKKTYRKILIILLSIILISFIVFEASFIAVGVVKSVRTKNIVINIVNSRYYRWPFQLLYDRAPYNEIAITTDNIKNYIIGDLVLSYTGKSSLDSLPPIIRSLFDVKLTRSASKHIKK